MSEVELVNIALNVIRDIHSFNLRDYRLGVRIGRLEFDVIAYYYTENGYERVVVIELKEYDFPKLVKQLIQRRTYGNYVYGAIKLYPYELLSYYYNDIDRLKDYGIGLIAAGCPILKSKFHRGRLDDYQE